ncbi:Protein SHQ1 homolog [Eumeta japonica]|uniref:Protein SHQ1 homolog n=1 Tax=Eumeta variegata TaxID=151549 RepID=A0A4C1V1A5_EUMVA|nr:Protein SHQ1 homolog [Eumeta japonica]
MLTPRFKLSQDENNVYIDIHAPFTNVADTEIDVDGENFLFISSPYFLRLRLPGKIIENEKSKGSYMCESGDFKLSFSKETSGEHFENMDMITSLLAPRDIPNLNPSLIEVLEEDGITIEENKETKEDLAKKFAYGFAQKITTNFHGIGIEFPQIFELKVPEEVSADERHVLRVEHENNKFSSDHYLADYYETELIVPYLLVKLHWQYPDFNNDADFTDDEVVKKVDLNLDLEELEYAANLVQKEEVDIMENMMAIKMESMSLISNVKKNNSQSNNGISSSSDCATTSDSSSDDSSSELDSDDD